MILTLLTLTNTYIIKQLNNYIQLIHRHKISSSGVQLDPQRQPTNIPMFPLYQSALYQGDLHELKIISCRLSNNYNIDWSKVDLI